jgi:hypothetical protein
MRQIVQLALIIDGRLSLGLDQFFNTDQGSQFIGRGETIK